MTPLTCRCGFQHDEALGRYGCPNCNGDAMPHRLTPINQGEMKMAADIQAAGYIIQDKQGNAIYGYGNTVAEAWAMTVDGAGPFFDAHGNEKDDEAAYTEDFKAYGATAALIAKVREDGGAIAWGVVKGVACTVAEEAAE